MSSERDQKKPDSPAEGAEEEKEAIARRLSDVFGGDGLLGGTDAEALLGGEGEDDDAAGPKLKLDKTGALAGRPKLKPRRPYARTGTDVPTAAAEDAEAAAHAKATIPPPLGSFLPPEMQRETNLPPVDEIVVPGGTFLYGEERESRDLPAFQIDRTPVTNGAYDLFVRATGHRPPLYWPDGKMPEELTDHPVVGVDYYDALAFAHWRGRDLPYEDEWERAARGPEGRIYPWGDEPELGEANTARLGHKMTLPIAWHAMNVSPDGVRDMVGNVWEITHSPAPGGGIVVRGGSWYDFALYAKTWFRFASRPDARNGTIGFRCVRRDHERTGAAREVDAKTADAEMRARRGPEPAIDTSGFSAERRDLVPDYRRLRQILAERAEEEGEGAASTPLRAVTSPVVGRRKPTKAAPPPRIRTELPEDVAPKPKPKPKPKQKQKSKAKSEDAKPPAEKASAAESATPKSVTPKSGAPKSTSTPPSTAESERVHVTTSPGPTRKPQTPAAPSMVPGRVPEAPPPTAASPRAGEQPATPLLYWGFLGAALLLVATFLVLLIAGVLGTPDEPGDGPETARIGNTDGDGSPVAPPPAPSSLPPLAADERDADEPRFVGGTERGLVAPLEKDVWLLVFVSGRDEASRRSVASADEIHRRLRDTGARLALVAPKSFFAGLGASERLARLRALGGNSDLTIVVDPFAGDAYGGSLRTHFRIPSKIDIAALLLAHGEQVRRVLPPEGGVSLDVLTRLAESAVEMAGDGASAPADGD